MKLTQTVHDYITLKQSMGSRFYTEETILKAFCNAVGDVAIVDVKPHQVDQYLAGNGPITLFWHRKNDALKGFYRFALGRGYVLQSPMPTTIPKRPQPFQPYIYSQEELRKLIKATDEYDTPKTKLDRATLRTLILLLYGAGLRISEALALTIVDVDFNASILTIHDSKFYKTRLVPIGPQLTTTLQLYADNLYPRESNSFFVTSTGITVTRSQAERAFVRLRKIADVAREDGARYQPRLHDLRHSMAVHRLTAWYREGADVQYLLPYLATYLGHVDIAGTQRYLTMTPELLREASQRFEHYALP